MGVAQTRPGGLVVTPWNSVYKSAGLLSLAVGADGTATGGLVNTTISIYGYERDTAGTQI